ncbi:MAG: sigma factor [Candidatus Burarchaeum sp.]|nr:sigma factor [Candidatus Burarchaeum sp.]MDO8339120.1 sigma factor [Candidatus Burarchaeum sp.]
MLAERNRALMEEYRKPGTSEKRKREIWGLIGEMNERQIYKRIKRFYDPKKHLIEDCDLANVAKRELIEPIKKFDPKKGKNFMTYATWYIDEAIRRELQNNAVLIREPDHIDGKRRKIGKADKEQDLTEEDLTNIAAANAAAVVHSLEAPIGQMPDGTPITIGDRVQDMRQNPEDKGFHEWQMHLIRSTAEKLIAAGELERRDWEVVLEWSRGSTLVELAYRYGRGKEGIRQIKEKTLKKIRSAVLD